MKVPNAPPKMDVLLNEVGPNKLTEILSRPFNVFVKGNYIHWDKLRYLIPPEGMTLNEWWLALKIRRMSQSIEMPLKDVNGRPFLYLLPSPLLELLHKIDLGAGGTIEMPE